MRPWLCRQNTVLPGIVALMRFLGVEIGFVFFRMPIGTSSVIEYLERQWECAERNWLT
jgi:hypothetical protein